MLSPLPRHSDWGTASLIPPVVSAFPGMAARSACATSFSRLARRSLALRPAHSRCHRMSWHASPEASTVSLPPQLLRLLPAGAVAGWDFHPLGKAPPLHGARQKRSFPVPASACFRVSLISDAQFSCDMPALHNVVRAVREHHSRRPWHEHVLLLFISRSDQK